MAKTLPKAIELSRASRTARSKQCRGPQDLSRLELECMKAIWLRRAATVADVRECLSSYRPLAYTTVLTVLDRLAKKGAVTRVKRGKTHFYEPLLCFEAARDSAVAGLLDFYFEGTVEMMIDYLNGKGSAPGRENHLTQDQNSSAKPSEEMQDCLL